MKLMCNCGADAELTLTWVTKKGGPQEYSGCERCINRLWEGLSRFRDEYESSSVKPVTSMAAS
jgi:hypothetical protein